MKKKITLWIFEATKTCDSTRDLHVAKKGKSQDINWMYLNKGQYNTMRTN